MPRGLSPVMCNAIEKDGKIPDPCLFLNPTLHFCPYNNNMLIDDTDPEFERCKCDLTKLKGRDELK